MILGAQLEGRGRPSLPFLKNDKSVLILEKKAPECVYPWVKFFNQNVVLGVSRRKTQKFLLVGPFFLVVLTKYL